MEGENLLKRADQIQPHFYHLKSHRKAYNIFNYKHEKICADIYCTLQPYLNYWNCEPEPGFEEVGLKCDRASIVNKEIVFWEIDRSTMTTGKVKDKVARYLKLAKGQTLTFSVVFACSNRRAKSLINVFSEFKNSRVFFYTVDIKELLNNPTDKIFNSPTLDRVTLLSPQKDS